MTKAMPSGATLNSVELIAGRGVPEPRLGRGIWVTLPMNFAVAVRQVAKCQVCERLTGRLAPRTLLQRRSADRNMEPGS